MEYYKINCSEINVDCQTEIVLRQLFIFLEDWDRLYLLVAKYNSKDDALDNKYWARLTGNTCNYTRCVQVQFLHEPCTKKIVMYKNVNLWWNLCKGKKGIFSSIKTCRSATFLVG